MERFSFNEGIGDTVWNAGVTVSKKLDDICSQIANIVWKDKPVKTIYFVTDVKNGTDIELESQPFTDKHSFARAGFDYCKYSNPVHVLTGDDKKTMVWVYSLTMQNYMNRNPKYVVTVNGKTFIKHTAPHQIISRYQLINRMHSNILDDYAKNESVSFVEDEKFHF